MKSMKTFRSGDLHGSQCWLGWNPQFGSENSCVHIYFSQWCKFNKFVLSWTRQLVSKFNYFSGSFLATESTCTLLDVRADSDYKPQIFLGNPWVALNSFNGCVILPMSSQGFSYHRKLFLNHFKSCIWYFWSIWYFAQISQMNMVYLHFWFILLNWSIL